MEKRETKISADCLILYTDDKGQASEREVSFRKLIETERGVYALGLCRVRQGIRLFKVDQIELLIDRDTGEGFADSHAYFKKFVRHAFPSFPRNGLVSPLGKKRQGYTFVERMRLLRARVPLIRR